MMAGLTLALLIAGGDAAGLVAQDSARFAEQEKQVATTQSKFHCNTKALTPVMSGHNQQAIGVKKLTAARKKIVRNGEKGTNFSTAGGHIACRVGGVGRRGKNCCPFFDFHIDVEREGKLLCLRLTGEEGSRRLSRGDRR